MNKRHCETRLAEGFAARWCLFLRYVGKQAMMDFGLSGLLDRFEKDFGRKATVALEFLIGLTIVCVCLGIIWSFVQPILTWASGSLPNSGWFETIRNVALYAGGAFLRH